MKNETIKTIIIKELEEKNLIFPFISDISQREIAVLNWRKQRETLDSIGKKLGGYTRERIRQIEQTAKSKINAKEEIIDRLTSKISEVVFSEEDIEKGFFEYLPKGTPVSKAKLEWNKFQKKLWTIKGQV